MSVSTSGGQMSVIRRGHGPAVLLLHPLALSGSVWATLSARLVDRFEVIAVDLRGHGHSGWDGQPFTVGDFADDVAQLMDALDLPTAHVVGMSMGGSVAIQFAARYRERVNRFVLADTTAWYGPEAEEEWNKRAHRVRNTPRVRTVAFQVKRWFTDEFRRTEPVAVNAVVQAFLATDSTIHATACEALGTMDSRPVLADIEAPTLVLVGEEDYATPPSMAEMLAKGIASAELIVVPGARHLSLLERPNLSDTLVAHLSGKIVGQPSHPGTDLCACKQVARERQRIRI